MSVAARHILKERNALFDHELISFTVPTLLVQDEMRKLNNCTFNYNNMLYFNQ